MSFKSTKKKKLKIVNVYMTLLASWMSDVVICQSIICPEYLMKKNYLGCVNWFWSTL